MYNLLLFVSTRLGKDKDSVGKDKDFSGSVNIHVDMTLSTTRER